MPIQPLKSLLRTLMPHHPGLWGGDLLSGTVLRTCPRTGRRPAGSLAGPLLSALLLVPVLATPALARDLLVAPPGTVLTGDPQGTAAAPFPSVQAALAARNKAGGDRIVLMDGEYGEMILASRRPYDPPVEIAPQNPGAVHLTKLFVKSGGGLRISGLSIWPLAPLERHYVLLNSRGDDVRFTDMDLRGRADAPETYMSWTKADWTEHWGVNGVRIDGDDNAFTDSRLTGVAFGITTYGDRAEVRGNRILGFSGDGMRGTGDDSVFADNHVENVFHVSANHYDGFQSWARKEGPDGKKLVTGMRITGNTILEWTGPKDHPLRGPLQGIGLFDGTYRDFTIANNLVVVTAYHGITVADGVDNRIVNNTVVNPDGPAAFPWIRLGTKRKDPEAMKHTLVANNVAMAYGQISNAQRRNAKVKFPGQFFVDPAAGDYRPRADSPLIGRGDATVAPDVDILGQPRGTAVSLGAYQSP